MPAPPSLIDLGSGINTQDTINKLMELERTPIRRIEGENVGRNRKIKAWESLRKMTEDLASKSTDLHSIAGPFTKRLIVSSRPDAVSGTAINNAEAITQKIRVKQLAERHKIHTTPFPSENKLPSGSFDIQSGEKRLKLSFQGGSLSQFRDFLEAKASVLLQANLTNSGQGSQILEIESKTNGSAGKLRFHDPQGLLKKVGLLSKKNIKKELPFLAENLQGSTGEKGLSYKIQREGKSLALRRGSVKMLLPTSEKIQSLSNGNLQVKLIGKEVASKSRRENVRKGPVRKQSVRYGPEISIEVGPVRLTGKNISRTREISLGEEGESSSLPLIRTKLNLIYRSGGKEKSLSFDKELLEGQAKDVILPLKDLPPDSQIEGLSFQTDGGIEILSPSVILPQSIAPSHEIQGAKDAVLTVNGIPMRRTKNEGLEDVITGASLNLNKVTKEDVQIEIKVDEDKILAKVKEWIESYNLLLRSLRKGMKTSNETELSVAGGRSQSSRNQRGIFSADLTVRQLTAQMNEVVSSAYPVIDEQKGFHVLPDIGISTGKIGSNWKNIREGLLVMDETKFKDAAVQKPIALKNLFSSDTNKDRAIDHGVAYQMSEKLKPYNQASGGLISIRIELLKEKIRSSKDQIHRREEIIERKRKNLRQQFGRMEQAIKKSKNVRNYLNRFGTQPQNNQ